MGLSAGVLGPKVFASEEDVCPSERRNMGEKMVGGIEPFAAPGLNGMAKVQGVPVSSARIVVNERAKAS